MIFKEDEIPFEELSEIGITKENFFNLPIDILNRILLGRLSPVMEFKILVDGESHILKGKFAFHRKDEKVQLKLFPVNKKFPYQDTFTEDEIRLLREGRIIKSMIMDGGKKVMSYIQLDPEINTLVSIPVNQMFIPSIFSGKSLPVDEIEIIKQGDILQLNKGDKSFVITIELIQSLNLLLVEERTKAEWIKERAIEWDRISPNVTGYWLVSENGWQYQKYMEEQTYKRKT